MERDFASIKKILFMPINYPRYLMEKGKVELAYSIPYLELLSSSLATLYLTNNPLATSVVACTDFLARTAQLIDSRRFV